MKKCLVWVFIVLVLSLVSETEVCAGETSVGYIDASSDDAYTLLRNGESVSPPPVYVFNGDMIVPQKGKSLKLIYVYEKCGEQTISKETVVKCDAKKEKPGWFRSLFEEVIVRSNFRRYDIDVEEVTGSKGETEKKKSCFPGELLRLTPWPVDGTTVLYGEPVIFRWEDIFEETLPCTESTLVITGPDGKEIPTKPMKTGEIFQVSGEAFREKTAYKWCVKVGGKKISEDYHFRILSKAESDDIRSKVMDISGKQASQSPAQALCLQILSDTTPKLDLYADSLRIITAYRPTQKKLPAVAGEVLRRISGHGN